MSLSQRIEALYAQPAASLGADAREAFAALRDGLEQGTIRAAEPAAGGWRVNGWVKKGILLGFRLGKVVPMEPAGPLRFYDASGDEIKLNAGPVWIAALPSLDRLTVE